MTQLPRWVRAADALAVVLLALTVWAALFGGVRFFIGEMRISITGIGRLLLETGAVIALRHYFYRRPTLLDRVRSGQAGPTVATVLPIFVTTRLMVLFVGFVAVITIGYPKGSRAPVQFADTELLNLPVRWDTPWYVSIAADGYRPKPDVGEEQNLNFFPAFPYAMRFASGLLGPSIQYPKARMAWAGVLVGMAGFLWSLVYLYRFARDRYGHDAAAASLMLLATYPYALFYSASYSEGLFLLAAVGAFVHARRHEFLVTAVWGLLAGLTRPNGCLLAVPLGALVLLELRAGTLLNAQDSADRTRGLLRTGLALAAASTPVIGMGLYSLWVYNMTGRPFFWAELQQVAWGRTPIGPVEMVTGLAEEMNKTGLIGYLEKWPYDTFHLFAALFAIGSIWPVTRRIGIPEGLFVAINVFVALFNGSLISMGRFTSVLFPSFLWLGLALPPQYRTLVITVFAMGQAIAAALFFTWRKVF